MDIRAIREFVNDHPSGVKIRMIDGTEYVVPYRDWVWFTPTGNSPDSRTVRVGTSFFVSVDSVGRLINALLVKEVVPLKSSNKSKRRKKAA